MGQYLLTYWIFLLYYSYNNNFDKNVSNLIEPVESRALKILRVYNGNNDYLKQLKNDVIKRSYILTQLQAKYVIKSYNVEPKVVDKWVDIHPHYAEELMKKFGLGVFPKQIFIQKILHRDGDSLHIWGKPSESFPYNDSFFVEKLAFKKLNPVPEIDWEKYTRPPKAHQITAITTLLQNDKFILADDMGLGKTTSAVIAAIEGNFKKILIVCPASLKLNWKREIEFYDKKNKIAVVSGNNWETGKWTIVNYDILNNFHHTPRRGVKISDLPISPIDYAKFDLIIADEAHYLKSSTAARTKIFNDFASRIPKLWLLTGTPITNKPIDFYNLLFLCDSPIAQNWAFYVKRYCDGRKFYKKGAIGEKKQQFWVADGASNLEDLNFKTKDVMLRRLKGKDLPMKTVKPIYLDLEHSTLYRQYLTDYINEVKDQEREEKVSLSDHLTKLIKIRQLLSYDKIKYTIDLAEELIDAGKKVIIFSVFKDTIRSIYEHFGNKAVIIDGSVTKERRQAAVDAFQTDKKIKIFCGNIVAAGVGLTLTEAEVVIFNDLDWVPANHAQAEDRAHRIGQINDVHVIYMLFEETLDTLMYDSLDRKKKVIAQIMGDDQVNFESKFENISADSELTETMISEVINKLKEKLFN